MQKAFYPNENGEDLRNTKYSFEADFASEIARKLIKEQGYKLTTQEINGKKIPFLQKFDQNGKLIANIPFIEREIDLYVTGIYKPSSGRFRNRELKVQVRLGAKIKYFPVKEYVEEIRKIVEEKAIDNFEEWVKAEGTGIEYILEGDSPPEFNKIEVNMRESLKQ